MDSNKNSFYFTETSVFQNSCLLEPTLVRLAPDAGPDLPVAARVEVWEEVPAVGVGHALPAEAAEAGADSAEEGRAAV